MRDNSCWILAAAVACAVPGQAQGQGLESFGARGAAMAAFVAVADDATAVAWNPAGLVSGPFFNLVLDLGRSTEQPDAFRPSTGRRVGTTVIAFGSTPVGLTYYRIAASGVEVTSPAVVGSPGREDRQALVRTLVTNHLGATVQQSIGDSLTLGATVKLVRGSVGAMQVPAGSWEEAFDRADRLDTRGSTRGDVDLGAMLEAGRLRLGAVVRNLTAPTFGDSAGGVAAGLDRHARVGVAWGSNWPGTSRTIAALDADVTRVTTPSGDRRDVAAGVERWMRSRQVGLRAGVRASVVGASRPVMSAGASYAVRTGMYVDVHAARGTRDERAWGLAARLTY